MTITIDPTIRATRLLTEAITAYVAASKTLADASERAFQASAGRDASARRNAYQALTELGDKVRLAERHLARTAQQVHAVLTATDMENIAKKLDRRDTPDSAWVLVKAIAAA